MGQGGAMGVQAKHLRKRFITCCVALVVTLLAGSAAADAFPGQLDPTFGSGGAAINQFSSAAAPLSIATDVAPAPEGKIVAAGEVADANGHAAVAVARYLANGLLD